MQFHHPHALLAASTNRLLANIEIGPNTLLLLVAIAIIASVMGNFLASLLLAKNRATFGRAVLTLVAEILYAFGCAIGALVLAILFGAARISGDLLSVVLLLVPVLLIIVWVMIPMRVYEIGTFRSIAFILLSGLIAGVIHSGAQLAIVGRVDYANLTPQLERMLKTGKFMRVSNNATDSDTTERRTALRRQFEQLEIRRKYLPPNDRKALADYERDKAAYERDVEEFKADTGE
jgi:hypothetical protein